MENDDFEVQALQMICDTNGGFRKVASILGVNDQTLYQILTRVKLPSGAPKGIGPKIRKSLNQHFPAWNARGLLGPVPVVGTAPPSKEFSPHAAALARLFDSIPSDDLETRGKAFAMAGQAINAAIQESLSKLAPVRNLRLPE